MVNEYNYIIFIFFCLKALGNQNSWCGGWVECNNINKYLKFSMVSTLKMSYALIVCCCFLDLIFFVIINVYFHLTLGNKHLVCRMDMFFCEEFIMFKITLHTHTPKCDSNSTKKKFLMFVRSFKDTCFDKTFLKLKFAQLEDPPSHCLLTHHNHHIFC